MQRPSAATTQLLLEQPLKDLHEALLEEVLLFSAYVHGALLGLFLCFPSLFIR